MLTTLLTAASIALSSVLAGDVVTSEGIQGYTPTRQNIEARQKFSDDKFGIFIHWGVYSMMGRGEWVESESKIPFRLYSKQASAFYPYKFDAKEWVSAIKASGAKYITITSRHHDGFSMFKSAITDYNIVDFTPFKRDPLKELADECHKQGITLNFYYSLVDWSRADYPRGTSGLDEKDPSKYNYQSYLDFMCGQITELLTNYGPVGCIWFDGDWDLNPKPKNGEPMVVTFDWGYERIYRLIHELQPSCLVANNHHRVPIAGEDIQLFERDVPGENEAGYSRTSHVSNEMPLETCKTMSKNWGHDIRESNVWKSPKELLSILIRTAGRNANLLLNIGPQPDGCLPDEALERLQAMGEWMNANGETIYGTRADLIKPQKWGVVTNKANMLYLHVTSMPEEGTITLPAEFKVKVVNAFATGEKLVSKKTKQGVVITLPSNADCSLDYIVAVTLK